MKKAKISVPQTFYFSTPKEYALHYSEYSEVTPSLESDLESDRQYKARKAIRSLLLPLFLPAAFSQQVIE